MEVYMGKQLSPLEKEFLIKTYRAKTEVKLSDFCEMNDVSETSMRKWIKQYEAGGIEGLSRAGEMGECVHFIFYLIEETNLFPL